MARKPYPSDVTDAEWDFVAPYLTLMNEEAPQRQHDLREVFNAMRWIVHAGSPWRYMPNDLPPWRAVYQQTQRWLTAGVFEAMTHDLRELLRMLAPGGGATPSAAIFDSRMLRSAAAMLAARTDDGIDVPTPYTPGAGPDDWQPTPPAFASALLPQFATLPPFGLTSPDQFRATPPPSITSDGFTQAFDEIKAIGAADSATPTAEQTAVARYWAGPLGTVQPPGQWNRIARGVATERSNSLGENARLFALLNFTMNDALIAAWDTKFTYNFVRPITAIHNADNDGNPGTEADPAWTPLLGTPGHSSYMAAHSTLSAAAATALGNFFGDEAIAFTDTSEVAAGGATITRSFDGFWEAAEEAGASRVYGGIHWSFDNQAGLQAGRSVVEFIADNLLRPRGHSTHEGDHPGAGPAPHSVFLSAAPSRSKFTSFFSDAPDDDELFA